MSETTDVSTALKPEFLVVVDVRCSEACVAARRARSLGGDICRRAAARLERGEPEGTRR